MSAMKLKRIIAIALLVLLLIGLGLYIYFGRLKPSSFVFVYQVNAKVSQIKKDVRLLKNNKYSFISAAKLAQLINKKENIQPRTICLFINKLPAADLTDYLKKQKVPVTFNIPPDKAKGIKGRNLSVGLRVSFPKAKPLIIKSGYVSFNFDDGYESVYSSALPVIKKSGYAASTFEIPQTEIDESENYLSAGEIRKLQSEGWEVGSHSLKHENFKKISLKTAAYSMKTSKGILQSLSIYVRGFAFPYGYYSNNTILLGKQYYSYLRFSDDNYNLPGSTDLGAFTWENRFNLKWFSSKINYAKNNKAGVIFVIHRIDNGGTAYSISPDLFKKAVSLVKKSKLPVYSNLAVFGKPLFLRQEYGHSLESEENYIKRLRVVLKTQKETLNKAGIKTSILYYPDGVVTGGLIKAAEKEGFTLGMGNRVGFLAGRIYPMDLKDILIKPGIVNKLVNY
jgi:peptidoglycan/xylan/chitin deacetylase (PgdA/CDA1 family)